MDTSERFEESLYQWIKKKSPTIFDNNHAVLDNGQKLINGVYILPFRKMERHSINAHMY